MPSLSPAGLSILAFGLSSLLAGLSTLLLPHQTLEILNLPLEALPAVRASALGATAIGLYYPLAAYQDNNAFFAATIPMRLLTTYVMWRQGWRGTAVWECAGAGLTGLCLLWAVCRGRIWGPPVKRRMDKRRRN